MKSAGNGNAQVCVQNIINVTKGEVPYIRDMGLTGDLYDKPIVEVEGQIMVEVEEQVEKYEPRAQIVNVNTTVGEDGHIDINPEINITE